MHGPVLQAIAVHVDKKALAAELKKVSVEDAKAGEKRAGVYVAALDGAPKGDAQKEAEVVADTNAKLNKIVRPHLARIPFAKNAKAGKGNYVYVYL